MSIVTLTFNLQFDKRPVAATLYRSVALENTTCLVHFPGGGFVERWPRANEFLCSMLAQTIRCPVLLVEYTLATASPFPAALHDCYNVASWAASKPNVPGLEWERIAVSGDSAGGGLAAAVTQLAKGRAGPPIAFQLLIYPFLAGSGTTCSRVQFEKAGLAEMLEGWRIYSREGREEHNSLAVPLNATALSGLPPAVVITGECDPLRDEGESYGNRLLSAGVQTKLCRVAHAPHGFMTSSKTSLQRKAGLEFIRSALGECM